MGVPIDYGSFSSGWNDLESKMNNASNMDPGEIMKMQQEMAEYQTAMKAAQEMITSWKTMLTDGIGQFNK